MDSRDASASKKTPLNHSAVLIWILHFASTRSTGQPSQFLRCLFVCCDLLKGFVFFCWKVFYLCVQRYLYLCIEIYIFVCCRGFYLCIERFCIRVFKGFFICVLKGVHFKGGPVDHVLLLLKCTEFATAQSIKLQLLHEVNKVKPRYLISLPAFNCRPGLTTAALFV